MTVDVQAPRPARRPDPWPGAARLRLRQRLCALAALLALLPGTWPVLAQNAPGAAAARRGGGLKPSSLVTVNFVNQDIEAVSRAMSAMMDKPILVDPRVKGVITVYNEQPLPVRDSRPPLGTLLASRRYSS